MGWLRADGRLVTLIKPHYEASRQAMSGGRKGRLDEDQAAAVLEDVIAAMPGLGVEVLGSIRSPLPGGKGGNIEYLALLRPRPA